MSEQPLGWIPVITLLLLALAAGVGWRAELEFRSGWASLAWLRYFHWAVPLSVAAFVVWVAAIAPVRRRAAFVAALAGFAVLAYTATDVAFRLFFAAGPSAAFAALSLGGGDFDVGIRRHQILSCVSLAVWPLIPLSFCFLCRLFGAPVSWSRALCSAGLFIASWPIAIFVRGFFEQHGSPDLIHALKSGFVVPFLIVSLGLPLLHLPSFLYRAIPRKGGT